MKVSTLEKLLNFFLGISWSGLTLGSVILIVISIIEGRDFFPSFILVFINILFFGSFVLFLEFMKLQIGISKKLFDNEEK